MCSPTGFDDNLPTTPVTSTQVDWKDSGAVFAVCFGSNDESESIRKGMMCF